VQNAYRRTRINTSESTQRHTRDDIDFDRRRDDDFFVPPRYCCSSASVA
jgi:hypothetical protein